MPEIDQQIISRAKALGATMAGIADIDSLKAGPTYAFLKKFGPKANGIYSTPAEEAITDIKWPKNVGAGIILALSHPEERPELDYWSNIEGGTPGNHILIKINRELSAWIEMTFRIATHRLPYDVESGGIYLKDAAVSAGLGCIGRNNVLVTPTFGSRVRLRAMLVEADLASTGPIDFDPCDGCEEYCRKACPQNAFESQVHSIDELGLNDLPGRDGNFSRAKCKIQMDQDVAAAVPTDDHPSGSGSAVKYCRQCELACPVGR